MFTMFEKVLSFRVTDTPLSPPLIRFPLAARFVSVMAFVGTFIPIASPDGVAARVRSRRNAGKSSWRRAASKTEVVRPVC
jgi:hypothetical protein